MLPSNSNGYNEDMNESRLIARTFPASIKVNGLRRAVLASYSFADYSAELTVWACAWTMRCNSWQTAREERVQRGNAGFFPVFMPLKSVNVWIFWVFFLSHSISPESCSACVISFSLCAHLQKEILGMRKGKASFVRSDWDWLYTLGSKRFIRKKKNQK